MQTPPVVTTPRASPPEGDVLRRAQAGDDEAFTRLVETWHPRVFRWACGMLDDPDDADDVAQRVLMRLYTHLSRFRGGARFSTWLYQITRNAARDAMRRRGRRLRALERLHVLDHDAVPEPAAEPGDPAVVAARAALARLPERQRAVFDLVELQGYAPQEAAALIGIAPATVRVHLLRARRTLRQIVLTSAPPASETVR
jgi:RNA polymerase sigma-70 factor (ECF subfamily)